MNHKFEISTLFATVALLPFVNCIPVTKSSSIDVPLVTFDGADSTTFKFHALNDPVMVSYRSCIIFQLFHLYDSL